MFPNKNIEKEASIQPYHNSNTSSNTRFGARTPQEGSSVTDSNEIHVLVDWEAEENLTLLASTRT